MIITIAERAVNHPPIKKSDRGGLTSPIAQPAPLTFQIMDSLIRIRVPTCQIIIKIGQMTQIAPVDIDNVDGPGLMLR